MASTDAHSIIEKIQLLQLSAATTLTEKYEKLRGWQNHEDFAIEDEVSHALAEHLRSSGCTVSDDDVPLHVLGVNGKHIYSFDCALMSVDLAGVSTLFLGEVKHYLTSSDITTAASKVKRLCERFRKLRDNKMPYEGPPLYIAQLHFYKALIDESRLVLTDGVKLFVGGTRINEDAVKLAAKCSYPIVAVNGGRFGVTAPCDVQELAHEEKDDEEV